MRPLTKGDHDIGKFAFFDSAALSFILFTMTFRIEVMTYALCHWEFICFEKGTVCVRLWWKQAHRIWCSWAGAQNWIIEPCC